MPRHGKTKVRQLPVHLLDTNVILRFLIGDDPPLARRATALMERVEQGQEAVFITDEVLTETVWTLESYYQVRRSEIGNRLIALLNVDGVRVSSRDTLSRALQFFASGQADFVDCMLAARGNQKKVSVYTFDETDFKKLPVAWEKP
jgi:predicted nucleic-acid-binding protein